MTNIRSLLSSKICPFAIFTASARSEWLCIILLPKVNIAKDPKKHKQYLTNYENDKLGEIKRIIFNNKSSQISNNTNNS